MRNLTKAMKKMLEGLAYADLAEMQSSLGKYHALAGGTSCPPQGEFKPLSEDEEVASRRRVGLFLGPFTSREVLEYVAGSCERMGAELQVFTFLGEAEARSLIETFLKDGGSLPQGYRIDVLSGDRERAIRRILGRGMRIDFMVCDEQGYMAHQILAAEMAAELPLVLVTTTRGKPDQRAPDMMGEPTMRKLGRGL